MAAQFRTACAAQRDAILLLRAELGRVVQELAEAGTRLIELEALAANAEGRT
jgi:hypothetical protein